MLFEHPNAMRTEKWYTRRLAAYCDRHYSEYEDEMEFFVDPSLNKWKFYIPSTKEDILITCDENGKVSQQISLRV